MSAVRKVLRLWSMDAVQAVVWAGFGVGYLSGWLDPSRLMSVVMALCLVCTWASLHIASGVVRHQSATIRRLSVTGRWR